MSQYVKVRFNFQGEAISGEKAWAEPVNDELYRLMNVPFFAVGYAEGDIVRCQQKEGVLEVIEIAQHSGNGTLRIIFVNSHNIEAKKVLEELVSVGCSYERASTQLVAITVPPTLEVPFSQLSNYINSISGDVLVGWEVGKRL